MVCSHGGWYVQVTVKWQLDSQHMPSPLGSSTTYPIFFQSSASCFGDIELSMGLMMRPARAPITRLPAKILSSGGQLGLSFTSLCVRVRHEVQSSTRWGELTR